MRRIFLSFSFIVLALCCINSIQAQSKEFENVIDVELKNSIAIRNNNTIVGYALFYMVDKMKKSALYRLEILDENLKSIGSNEFEGSKELELEHAIYESEHILLAFNDEKKVDGYEKFAKIFDLKGKQTGNVPYDPEKVKKGMFGKAIAENMTNIYNGFSNVEGKGFVCVYQSEAKVGGADIQMIDKSGKLKWEKNLSIEKGDRVDMYLTATTPNAIIMFSSERDGVMSRDSKNFLIGLDPETGKELYKKSMETGDIAWEPMLFKPAVTGDGIKMISILSHEEDKFFTAKPIGFNICDFNDKTGETKTVKPFLFEKDLSSVLDMKNESKSEDGYIKVHDLCLMPDGSYVVVGEFFRKTVSAGGMALKLLSRNAAVSASQASIGDMFLLRINKSDKPVGLDRIEKEVDRWGLPTDGLSIGLTARYLGYINAYGYAYTDEGIDPNKKTIIADGTFEGEKYGTAAITFDANKGYKIKKFNIEKEKKEKVYIRRGKPGHVVVMKYNSKEKKISMNLERVD